MENIFNNSNALIYTILIVIICLLLISVIAILLWGKKLNIKIKNDKIGEVIIGSNPSNDGNVYIDQLPDNSPNKHAATQSQVSKDVPIDLSRHPIFNEFDMHIEYGLKNQFDLTKWNQFLGYHVCKIMFVSYREYLSKLASGCIHEGDCTAEYLSMIRSLPDKWRSVILIFSGYKVYGIPQLMINKFHELRLNNIKYIGSYISDIVTRYSKRITRLSCIFEVIASSLFYYSKYYVDVLMTMNGDLDKLNPVNMHEDKLRCYSDGEYNGDTSE